MMYANMENNHLGYCTIDVPSVTVRLTILCPMFRDVFSYILARLTDVGIHLVIMVGHCHVSVACSTLCVQLYSTIQFLRLKQLLHVATCGQLECVCP